jgi:MAF protein
VLGLEFEACSANVCETIRPGESAIAAAQRLAQAKATTVAERMNPRRSPLVIGADTIVVLDGEAVGNPKDAQEAETILRRLHGREHKVLTALSLVAAPNADPLGCVTRTTVWMREYTSEEMSLYVCSGGPLDKAGAYAIQDPVFRPAAGLAGCFANVMGLPLCHLTVLLRKLGIEPARDVAAACQEKTGHTCTVFTEILDRHSQSSQPLAATGGP